MGLITVAEKLKRFTMYVTLFVVREWLISSSAEDAAANDLNQYMDLTKSITIYPDIVKVAMDAIKRQSWYLNERFRKVPTTNFWYLYHWPTP